MLRPKLGLKPN